MQNRALKTSSCEFRYLWGWASWKHEWWVPVSRGNSEVPRKAEALSSNRSGRRQIVVTAVPLSIRPPMTQPFVFPACTSHPTLSLGFWVLHSCNLSNTFPLGDSSHMFRFISRHWSTAQRRDIREASQLLQKALLFLLTVLVCQTQQAKQKCSSLLHILPLMFDAPAQPFWTSKDSV